MGTLALWFKRRRRARLSPNTAGIRNASPPLISITAAHIKAARTALGWTIAEIARDTSIGSATLKRCDAAPGVPKSRKGHLEPLRHHFEAAGIAFIGAPDGLLGIGIAPPQR